MAEKINLSTPQQKMKIDPEGYEIELTLLYKHFDALLFLFQQQSALKTLGLSMELQTSGDRTYVIHSALIVLNDLHRRIVWFDERTTNAICTFFVFVLKRPKAADYSDADSSEDEKNPQVVPQKKMQANLDRAISSMKRQQLANSEKISLNYFSALNRLIDAQGFAKKLFSRLQTCNERFEVRMMILKVIEQTVGLHPLILLNFYPFRQKCVQPHQRDITDLLASAVQACHDMVPPDAVEPLFRQVVNQFVHDKARTEEITVGLNAAREIFLLMTKQVCPSWLVKKDRGRPTNPKAQPKAFARRSTGMEEEQENSNKLKRTLSDYAGELNADKSHWVVMRIAESTREIESSDLTDEAKLALRQHGLSRRGREAKAPAAFKIPTNIRRKMTEDDTNNKKNMPKVAKRARLHDLYKRKRLNRIPGKQIR
ncbi:hypothetical protein MKW92_052987 [Papaver armeniacum]|nr:hypothetical protein MKW92_052987 [Papaver armeniacum]